MHVQQWLTFCDINKYESAGENGFIFGSDMFVSIYTNVAYLQWEGERY